MEKKKISKLRLNKKTLQNLDDNKLAEVHGGLTEFCSVGCTTHTRSCSLCTVQCSVCCQ
jgi:natural product precursor